MNTQRTRSLPIIVLSIILSFALILSLTIGQVDAAKKVKMPTKVTEYEMSSGEWYKIRTTTYTYNKKGDCTKTTRTFYEYDGEVYSSATIKLKYTYKKGKKIKVVATGPYEKHIFTYDKKQRISKIQAFDEDSGAKGDISIFTYDSKGYLKTIDRTTDNTEYTDRKQTWTYNTVISGSKVTIAFNGRDFYGEAEGPEDRILKNGLLVKKLNYCNDIISEYTYTIAKKGSAKGLVTTRYCTQTDNEGDITRYKTTYKYGKRKSTKTKYYKILNKDERVVVSHLYYIGD